MNEIQFQHKPVMVGGVLEYLRPKAGGIYVDGTLGGGGHTKAILKTANCRIIGIDRDLEAIFAAKKNLADYKDQVTFVHNNFSNLPAILRSLDIPKVDGILLDLGVSSHQLESPSRGFSFQKDAPLDMRMDQRDDLTAGKIINFYDEKKLADLFYKYGEERYSRQIAKKIIERRGQSPRRGLSPIRPIRTTDELVEIIKSATPPEYRFNLPASRQGSKIHFATRVFQALRIEVNDELKILEDFIPKAAQLLAKDGRLLIISFHSLEDRIVKHTFRDLAQNNPKKYKILTKKPITPSVEEITRNPRSRSAKMRVLEKTIEDR